MIYAILAILGGAAFWWWRLKMIGDAANDVSDVAGRAWGKYKRHKFRKKVEDSPLQTVDDPATAAVVMMYAMAKEAGPITGAVDAAIRSEVSDTMKIGDADELITFGKWAASHATDASNVILRYVKLWNSALNADERRDFADMVERVAEAAGPLDSSLRAKLGKLRERLGLIA
jgi:uncharacterized tellurite resistance protein B-like protein